MNPLTLEQIEHLKQAKEAMPIPAWAKFETFMLKLRMQKSWIHGELHERWNLMDRIKFCDRNGWMLVEEHGRDCDMAEYSGRLHKCKATYAEYRKLQDSINDWADGPFWTYPVTPEEAKSIKYQSRDRALEAHEDGHPWVIYI